MLRPIAHTSRSFNPAVPKAIPLPTGAADPRDTIEMMGASMHFKRNAEIYGDNEPADYLYKVASGAVRTYKVPAVGRLVPFIRRAMFSGLRVETCTPFRRKPSTKILVVKRSALVARAACENDVARQLWAITGRELQRVQDHMLALIKRPRSALSAFCWRCGTFVGRQSDRIAYRGKISRTTLA